MWCPWFSVLCERYCHENVSSNHSSTLVAVCGLAPSCWYQTLDARSWLFSVEGLVKIFFSANLGIVQRSHSPSESSTTTKNKDEWFLLTKLQPKSDFVRMKMFFLIKIWFFRTTKAHVLFIFRCIERNLNKSVPRQKTICFPPIPGSAFQSTLQNPIDC